MARELPRACSYFAAVVAFSPEMSTCGRCSIITVVAYTQINIDDTMMLFLGFPLGFFASGIFSGMGPFLTELFPTRVRGSGQGFAYNFGRGIAAINPFFVGL